MFELRMMGGTQCVRLTNGQILGFIERVLGSENKPLQVTYSVCVNLCVVMFQQIENCCK